jgi:transcriptional regulator with XRE-family HTH domain
MTHQEQVAERLAQLRREKSARERRDVLQSEIAEAAGVSVVTYGRYENGRRKIPNEIVIAIAKFYAVPPGHILFGEPVTGTLTDEEVAAAIARSRAARGSPSRRAVANGEAGRKSPKHPRGGR